MTAFLRHCIIVPDGGTRQQLRARLALMVSIILLVALSAASLAIGSRPVPLAETLAAFTQFDPRNDLHLVVRELRLPRTILGLAAGAALGLSGAVMQALSRNPLAEPGLLGINAGAATAVVLGASWFGMTAVTDYMWFGILGAGLAGAAVAVLGRDRSNGFDPVRLVLAGAGLSILLGATTGVAILNSDLEILDIFRKWSAGALEGRGIVAAVTMVLALAAGGAAALVLGHGLNALALGPEMGAALGLETRRICALACGQIMLLCGTATATAGPIGFVGLAAPHLARAIGGPDYRIVLPLSAMLGAVLLLIADILGRILARPDEVAAGIVAAVLGGPVFILIVRRIRIARV